MKPWSFQNGILLPTIMVVAAGALLSSVVSYRNSSEAMIGSAIHELEHRADSTATQVDAWIGDRSLDVQNWANQKVYAKATQDGFVGDSARISADRELAKSVESYWYYERINVVGTNGFYRASSETNAINRINLADRDYFKTALLGNTVVSDVVVSKVTGRPVFIIASPIRDEGTVVGVMTGVVDLKRFNQQFFAPVENMRAGFMCLWQQNGLMISHPQTNYLLKFDLKKFDWGRAILASSHGSLPFSLDGEDRLIVYRRLPRTGWYVGACLPVQALKASARKIAYLNLLIGFATLLVTVAVIIAMVRPLLNKLADSHSLIHATLESTAEGILAVDTCGRVTGFNERLRQMWNNFPITIGTESNAVYAALLPRLKNAERFLAQERELVAHPEKESFDVLEFTDGRAFERCSRPQRIEARIVGRVWSYRDITERKRMENEVEKTHLALVAASHEAGMAEVATSVLHNVGNVLTSINVAASLLADKLRQSNGAHLAKVVTLMHEQGDGLGEFMRHDPKGRRIPAYLAQLARYLDEEQAASLREVDDLKKNVEHINEIVAMQQAYARVAAVKEPVKLTELVEDALRIHAAALTNHNVKVIRDYAPQLPEITVEKHKVLQILVNLIGNAEHACDDGGCPSKQITLRVRRAGEQMHVTVADNGVGILPENLTKIFHHGFTTRKNGHGFGLHSCALAAKTMGADLVVQSAGLGQGAAFTLRLPL